MFNFYRKLYKELGRAYDEVVVKKKSALIATSFTYNETQMDSSCFPRGDIRIIHSYEVDDYLVDWVRIPYYHKIGKECNCQLSFEEFKKMSYRDFKKFIKRKLNEQFFNDKIFIEWFGKANYYDRKTYLKNKIIAIAPGILGSDRSRNFQINISPVKEYFRFKLVGFTEYEIFTNVVYKNYKQLCKELFITALKYFRKKINRGYF